MKQSFFRVLIPTFGQALGCTGASILLIGFLYHDQISHRIKDGALNNVLGQIGYGNQLASITSSPIIHTLVIVAFWSGVGLVAYTVVWSLINVAIEAKNELVLETAYTNKSAFAQRVKTPLLQLGLAAGLFIGLLFAAHVIFPFWMRLAASAISTQSITTSLGYAVAAVFGTAATIYVLILMGQLIFWLG